MYLQDKMGQIPHFSGTGRKPKNVVTMLMCSCYLALNINEKYIIVYMMSLFWQLTLYCSQTRDGFGPNFFGPRPIWADFLWAGPRLGPFSRSDLWAWAGPGLSCFGLGWALGQIENQCWAKFGPFSCKI